MNGLAQKIISDKELEKKAFLYLKRQLDEETAKPSGKRDYDKIAVLTNELCELSDGLDQSSDIVGQKQRLYSKISEYNAGKNKASVRTLRKIIPIICAAAIVFAANCISVSAWNMNIFSLAVELTQGGVKIDFGNKREEIILPTSENARKWILLPKPHTISLKVLCLYVWNPIKMIIWIIFYLLLKMVPKRFPYHISISMTATCQISVFPAMNTIFQK